jgi:hypothetical protein
VFGIVMCHRFVWGDFIPLMMVLPSYLIVAVSLVNVALQPELQSWLIEMREFCSCGITWAVVACGGSAGCK